jgi:hypothetical protein
MRKLILILFISLFNVVPANAQSSELLLGKWQFIDFYNPGITDSFKLEEAKARYKKFSMTFKADQHYIFYFVGKKIYYMLDFLYTSKYMVVLIFHINF